MKANYAQTCRVYTRDQFMNPGPAPRPPTDRPRVQATASTINVPGNASAMSLNSMGAYSGTFSSSNTSLSKPSEKLSGTGALSVIKEGFARTKEEGFMRIWSEKWLVLRESQLDFHKAANSPKISFTITLKDVTGVTRSENHPLSFEITRLANPASAISPGSGREAAVKTVICKVETDDDVYSWIDRIYERCPGMGGVSKPTDFSHTVHVGFDSSSGAFTGLPPEWARLLNASAITKEDYSKNPAAVIEVLNFYTEKLANRDDDDLHGYASMPDNMSTDVQNEKQFALATTSTGAASRQNPSNGYARQDSYSNGNYHDQAAYASSSGKPPVPQQSFKQQQSAHESQNEEQDRRRTTEENTQRHQSRLDQRERERAVEEKSHDEHTSYNSSAPKLRHPATQDIAGASAEARDPTRYNPTRAAPSAPTMRDRQQHPGSLRQSSAQRAQPPVPVPAPPGISTVAAQRAATPNVQSSEDLPRQPASNQPNGQTLTAPKPPRAASKSQEHQPRQPTTSAPQLLNVTAKQPTGPAAVAEAAKKAEEMPVKKEGRKDVRMSAMTEAQVMTRLREVVSKEPPLQSYNKQKKIGQGASGSVYVARIRETATSAMARQIIKQQGLRAQVAIKQMDLRNQPRKELIVNEIVVMKDSKHPNIVNFIEAFLPEEQTELWVVMEFMEGGPLTDVIDNNPHISEDQIATICFEVCHTDDLLSRA